MAKAQELVCAEFKLTEKYKVVMKSYQVPTSVRYPEGIKFRYALVDLLKKVPILVINNHAPFGFHAHIGGQRISLDAQDAVKAEETFWQMAGRIIDAEK